MLAKIPHGMAVMGCVQILIADDHELFRRTVRSFIESQPDFRVCGEATDGLEAVEKVRELQPHIVLMDINMPRMDGLEATRIIRREHPDCNVIIVTQNHATIAREQARGVNAHGSITKSDLTKDLLPTIENVFRAAHPDARKLLTEESVPAQEWVRGGGALGRLVQESDWSKTPLGAIEQWPQSLKTVVRTMLTSRFAMWMGWGPELTFLYNDAYAKMTLGKKHPWALGKPSQRVWEEIWSDIGPRIDSVLRSGNATWDEGLLLFLERSGYREETYHTFSYSPLMGDDGKVCGHLCVVTEETDRVIGERRLKTLRTLASELSKTTTEQDVVESIPRILEENRQDLPFSLTYLFSEDGRTARLCCRTGVSEGHPVAPDIIVLTSTNPAWPFRGLLGGKDSIVVEDLPARFSSIPAGAWDKPPERALLLPIASQSQNAPAGVLIAGLNPYRPLDVSYAGFLNLIAGQIAASVANARAYEQEKKRAESLAEIDRAKTVFFSNVSHEFRTPLTLMLAPLEDSLSASATLPDDHRQRLEVAHRNSVRLLKLVNTLLDFSRLEAGRIQASYEPTDLAALTSELSSLFRSATDRAGLKLLINCPPIEEPVYLDREMWEKIVFNLLSNAFKFTFTGEIEVTLQRLGGSVELSVRDTGTGIPAEEIPHLFERFYRVKSAHGRTFEGSGIGLALVQELAKFHGGQVRVESELDRGSTFTVSIPMGKAHLSPERISAGRTLEATGLRGEAYLQEALRWLPDAHLHADEAPLSALLSSPESLETGIGEDKDTACVLLADDNADMREYVQRLLKAQYEVLTVSDGEEALRLARERRPNIILSDIMMPRLDGLGLLQAVRADEELRSIPVILLSARAGEESRIEGLQTGADDYLVKPFSARELLARVKSHLNMARMRQEAADIERKLRAEAEFERARLRELAMQAPAAICLLNGPEHRYTFVNQEYLRVTGRTRLDEFVGKTVREALPEVEVQGFIALLNDVYLTGIPHIGTETKVTIKRGADSKAEAIYFNFIYQPIRNSVGQIEGIFAHGVDVTQQALARQEIERRERQFREMINALPAAIYTTDAQGRITHFNPAAVEFSGRTPELGTDQWCVSWKLYHPDGRRMPNEECPMAIALKSGRIIEGAEAIAERPDGTRRWFTPFPTPLRDEQGEVIGGINMLVDITERKHAENALADSLRRQKALFQVADKLHRATSVEDIYSTAMDAIRDALRCDRVSILLYDETNTMRFVSWCGLSERYRIAVEGHSPWKRTDPDPQPVCIDDIAQAALDKELKSTILDEGINACAFVPLVSGNKLIGKFMMYFNTPHAFAASELDLSLTIAHQIAFAIERKASEGALRESETRFRTLAESLESEVLARTKELEHRNAEVLRQSEQLRDLSQRLLRAQDAERKHFARELHDSAGQTLTVLGMTLSQLAHEIEKPTSQSRKHVETSQQLVQQLHQELRTTSYLLHPPLLDESGLASALGWYVEGLSKRSGLEIQLAIPRDFGRVPDMELVVFRLVQECLTNILRHAEAKRALIRVERLDGKLAVDIEDNGKGMSAQKLAEIQSGGSGVGILGMRERVAQFQGTLNIDSNSSGTRVSLSIPLPAAAPRESANDSEPLEATV